MIPKLTPADHLFAMQNFDKNGWLFDVKDEQREGLNAILRTGYAKYQHNGVNKMGYTVLGQLLNSVVSFHLSKLLNTPIIALSGRN